MVFTLIVSFYTFILIDPHGLITAVTSENEKDKGPGWTTVAQNEFTKFTMKRSPAKKFLEPGATVIYITTKVCLSNYTQIGRTISFIIM